MSLIAVIFVTLTVSAESAKAPANGAGKRIFTANCATCHGADGKGNSMGRTMGVKDLHAAEVVKLSDAQIKQVVANGKGNMPPWKGQLSDSQIAQVTAYVRSLQKTTSK
jgi:cbb3-type cytochrome c oxidase subunit III